MANKNRTWISILIAAIVIVVVLGLAVVGSSAYYIARHVHSQYVTSESAEDQMTRTRARFAGQTPLIEIREGGDPIVHRTPDRPRGAPIDVLHAMIYSRESRKLVTVNLPMWLLRMVPANNRFSFISGDVDFESSRTPITIEDVDRRGPGLILDGQDRHGARVLVWTE